MLSTFGILLSIKISLSQRYIFYGTLLQDLSGFIYAAMPF